MQLIIKADGTLERFSNQLGALGDKAPLAMQRALAHTGDKARTHVRRALVKQTGLSRATIAKAVQTTRPSFNNLSYTLSTKGGNIRLRYFQPRETRKGVSAKVQGARRVFVSSFMKAGWVWSKRIDKANWNRQVFRRVAGQTSTGMDKFEVVRSGVYIPHEMVKGETEKAWRMVAERDLPDRLRHEIGRLLPK